MAYQAKRSKKVIEDFELVDENGKVAERFHVELDASSMIEKLRKKHLALVKAYQDLEKVQAGISEPEVLQNAYTILGTATADMIESVFGAEDTRKILEFYEENYVEMSKEVMPFISGVVIPKVEAIAKQNKKELLSKFNRKQRRHIMRGLV